MATLHNLSSSRLLKSLPYDSEVKYLESTGIPYIDTGLLSDWSGLVVSMEVEVFDTFTGLSQNRFFFGSTFNPVATRTAISLERSASGNIRFYFRIGSVYKLSPNNLTTHQTITIDRPNGVILGEYSGGTWSRDASTIDWDVVNGNFNLFRVQGISNTSPSLAHSRFYMCRFIRYGEMIRDFIPVRVGDVGYMYDRVSKRLFGNVANSGYFIVGPDV